MSSPTRKIRLDELVVERGLSPTRTQAKAVIMAGRIRAATTILDKPGRSYPEDMEFSLIPAPAYVGRGGHKLAAFLDHLSMRVNDLQVLDVGASTGGFTDCLLQRGAGSITCIDVGRGQLHAQLLQDSRVTNLERVNARYLTATMLPRPTYHLIVADLSFISLKKVLPALWPILVVNGSLVTLVKPQFEATRKEASRTRGVIRDTVIHKRVIKEIRNFAKDGLPYGVETGFMESPIKGGDGNLEFFLSWKKRAESE